MVQVIKSEKISLVLNISTRYFNCENINIIKQCDKPTKYLFPILDLTQYTVEGHRD